MSFVSTGWYSSTPRTGTGYFTSSLTYTPVYHTVFFGGKSNSPITTIKKEVKKEDYSVELI